MTNSGDIESKDSLAEWGVVFVFVMILYMALLTWGITISRGNTFGLCVLALYP